MENANPKTTTENPPASGEMKPTVMPGYWTTEEVARYLHVSERTVFELRRGGLPCVLLGGAVRFIPKEIDNYMTIHREIRIHHSHRKAKDREAS